MSAQDDATRTMEKQTQTIAAEETAVPVEQDDGPPNGGVLAWLQVAGCFALYLNTL
jgi:hypothetical protein